jgi:hypothetical protein
MGQRKTEEGTQFRESRNTGERRIANGEEAA